MKLNQHGRFTELKMEPRAAWNISNQISVPRLPLPVEKLLCRHRNFIGLRGNCTQLIQEAALRKRLCFRLLYQDVKILQP